MILSFISIIVLDEFVAQSVEHLTFNQRVAGSNPTELTKENQGLRDFSLSPFSILNSICPTPVPLFKVIVIDN